MSFLVRARPGPPSFAARIAQQAKPGGRTPPPTRAGLLPSTIALDLGALHPAVLSLGAFAGLSAAAIAAINLFGDPQDASPRYVVALNGSAFADDGPFRAALSEVVLQPGGTDLEAEIALDAEAAPPLAADQPIPHAPAPPDTPKPLPKAPIAKLTAPGPMGPLPVIAPDGSTALQAYRRPFAGDAGKPRVAIVVGGLGFNAAVTQAAIEDLPPEVTLSFVPYAQDLQRWIDAARARGHEVLIELPMEPFDPATTDTGPQTLLAAAPAKDNIAKLENLLSRASGYFAVSNYQGGRFALSGAASAPVVKALQERGLGFVSNGIGQRAPLGAEAQRAGLPFAAADRVLDARREAEAIDDQLMNLETLAKRSGAAMGAGFAYPVTIEQISFWAQSVESRGLVLAPASTMLGARATAR